MRYMPIIGTLGYVLSPDKKKVLLVHRIARENDHMYGKYSGLGGKMNSDEDVRTCMSREIYEEAGIECLEMTLCGTINWTCFGKKGEDWLGFVFLIEKFSGTPHKKNVEGPLEWIDIEKIYDLPMCEGDRHFLPMVFDKGKHLFHGYMPYDHEIVLGWNYTGSN